MIKYIITAVIIYFLIRSFAFKPRQNDQINRSDDPTIRGKDHKSYDDGEFVDYEEVD